MLLSSPKPLLAADRFSWEAPQRCSVPASLCGAMNGCFVPSPAGSALSISECEEFGEPRALSTREKQPNRNSSNCIEHLLLRGAAWLLLT